MINVSNHFQPDSMYSQNFRLIYLVTAMHSAHPIFNLQPRIDLPWDKDFEVNPYSFVIATAYHDSNFRKGMRKSIYRTIKILDHTDTDCGDFRDLFIQLIKTHELPEGVKAEARQSDLFAAQCAVYYIAKERKIIG